MPAFKPTFVKLVASPTDSSWAQAYNAGSLFAVLSLTIIKKGGGEELKTLGKTIFTTLQSEFFTLEEKNLSSIREALTLSLKDVPSSIQISFCIAYHKNDILYVFISGEGKILLKRDQKMGTILKGLKDTHEIKAASGKIAEKDILVLETQQAEELVSEKALDEELSENVEESAEAFMPQIHGQDDGGIGCLFIRFDEEAKFALDEEIIEESTPHAPIEKKITPPIRPEPEEESYPQEQQQIQKEGYDQQTPYASAFSSLFTRFGKKRIGLSFVAIVLVVLLVGGIIATRNLQEAKKSKAAFEAIYSEATREYDEGQELLGLNDTLAKEDFQKAKETIEKGMERIKKNTDEETQLKNLLTKITASLGSETSGKQTNLIEEKKDSNPILQIAILHTDALFITKDDDTYFYITKRAIFSLSDPSEKAREVIKNDSDWVDASGFASYNGNIYVLDKKEGVLKYVPAADEYGKSNYFKDTKPDLSNTVSMAIDSSVWILYKDGNIMKFTKGAADSFSVTGLLKLPINPVAIVTDQDTDNLYILDAGAGRIIVITKEGSFKTQYQADGIKNSKMLVVNEKDKKAYILRDSKIFSITL